MHALYPTGCCRVQTAAPVAAFRSVASRSEGHGRGRKPSDREVISPGDRAGRKEPLSFLRRPKPFYLDGKQPGDVGFDPLRLAKDRRSFEHYREAEVMHARWAMVGVSGVILSELLGVPFGMYNVRATFPYAFTLLLAIGALEAYRGASNRTIRDPNRRVYPGRRFNPLGLAEKSHARSGGASGAAGGAPGLGVFASWLGGLPGWMSGGWWLERREATERDVVDMKTKELNNGRLAMISFLGIYVASALTGKGPLTLLVEHMADPLNHTVVQTLQHEAPQVDGG